MFPISDDVYKSWFGKATWSVIFFTSLVSIIVFNMPPESQLRVVQDYAVTPWGTTTFADSALRMFSATHLHGDYWHLFFNMLFLFAFGLSLEKQFGSGGFLALYYASAFAGWILFALTDHTSKYALGASGAVSGLMATYLLLFPRAKFLSAILFLWILKFFHIRAWVYICFWICIQVWSSFFDKSSHVAYQAHIGGIVLGLCSGVAYNIISRRKVIA